MTIAEMDFMKMVPAKLNEIADENASIATELKTLNEKLQNLIEILSAK